MGTKTVEKRKRVVIRFAGDSGDGMQLTGDRFTSETALQGNDLSTLPNYPAEIRAPAGTVPGVSSFQLHFADHPVLTPGDAPDVLVAMNPAALKANLADLPRGAMIIANTDEFTKRNMTKVGYTESPLDDDSLDSYHVHSLPITAMTVDALADFPLTRKEKERSKNMFALGLLAWLYNRPLGGTQNYLKNKFKGTVLQANLAALKAGYNWGEISEDFAVSYEIGSANMPPGTYRNITGNVATAYGLVVGAHRAQVPLMLGTYPITPATDILHTLAQLKRLGVMALQAEDEIAGIGMAIGASYGGALGVTSTSGPGLALKGEMMGLAVMLELPLVVVDVQRGGPSTGLPTKTEQSDLLQAMFGRNGESPLCVLAAATPTDCFDMAFEACRIAITYRHPVILLTDSYVANGAGPWQVPDAAQLPTIDANFLTEPNATDADGAPVLHPYQRDEDTLARPWVIPGTPGLTHRLGGLEKGNLTGLVNYEPDNHDTMCRLRAAKVERIADSIPALEVDDPSGKAEILVLGWGSTYGPIATGVGMVRDEGLDVAVAHLRYLNPFPKNLGEVLRSYRRVLVPEMNLGQLSLLLRAKFLVDVESYNQVRGLPFTSHQIAARLRELIDESSGSSGPGASGASGAPGAPGAAGAAARDGGLPEGAHTISHEAADFVVEEPMAPAAATASPTSQEH